MIIQRSSIRAVIILSFLFQGIDAFCQSTLFDNPIAVKLVKEGSEFLYATDSDSTNHYIQLVEKQIPNHPVVPMMEGMLILWENIPILSNENFERFKAKMGQVIELSNRMDREHPESVFFEMSARGILAEYYADRGMYMAAIGEATQAYGLLRRGFDLVEELHEFGFLLGIYNYFRVAYPEKHPIVKPFIWFFREGDKTIGLDQIKYASEFSIISSVEANIYLGYIYLRYEEVPEKAQTYVRELTKRYPKNLYILTKYLESLNVPGFHAKIALEDINKLMSSDKTYYKLVGNVFNGIYQEQVLKNEEDAFRYYTQAIGIGEVFENFGEHYRSLAYLGAGRIALRQGHEASATVFLEKAIILAETDEVSESAKELIP